MKKLLAILVLGLLWCNVSFAEEKIKTPEEFEFKPVEFKPVTVSSLVKIGFKIIDVQQQDTVLFYTLQKSKEVYTCIVYASTRDTRCFTP